VEKSRHAFKRACTIHLPQKASLHLAWAAFEERQGCPLFDVFVKFDRYKLSHAALVDCRLFW